MQWTIENMWAFHIQPDSTPFRNSYYMEYRLVDLFKYYRTTYFQCPLNMQTSTIVLQLKYAEGYVASHINYTINMPNDGQKICNELNPPWSAMIDLESFLLDPNISKGIKG